MNIWKSIRKLRPGKSSRPPIIVVSGLPRSGTSMMMNMLSSAGLEIVTDKAREADEDNPKGYFEDERIKNLDRSADKTWLDHCPGKVIKVISFLLKDLPPKHDYKVIFMHRDLDEVIRSQNKMLQRRDQASQSTDDDTMKQHFELHLRKVAMLIRERRNLDNLDVHYRQVLDDPKQQAHRVVEFLGMDLDADKMTRPVDESLYRNRQPTQ